MGLHLDVLDRENHYEFEEEVRCLVLTKVSLGQNNSTLSNDSGQAPINSGSHESPAWLNFQEEVLIGDIKPPTASAHLMVTCVSDGISKPNTHYQLNISKAPAVPTSVIVALADPIWRKVMTDELAALEKNDT